MDELRLAVRRLAKQRAATFVSIATLAAAIAASAVTWSVLSAVLVHPLPVRDADGLFVVATERPGRRGAIVSTGFLYPEYAQVRDSGAFAQTVAQWSSSHLLLVQAGDTPSRSDVQFVTHDFFDTVGVQIALGRGFTSDDDRRGATLVAVLTDRYWRQAFGADPAIVGRTIRVSDRPATIVGVLPKRFRGLNLTEKPDLYLPFHTVADVGSSETNYFAEAGHRSAPTAGTMIVGRLRGGASALEARDRVAALEPGAAPGRPAPRVFLMPANVAAIPPAVRSGMAEFSGLLAATVGLLLLIGCITVGMLLLLRTDARRAELATCIALGASRARLARGIAVEGAVIAATGATAALPVAYWLFGLIRGFDLPGDVSIDLLELSLDAQTIGACIAAAAGAVLLIALVAGMFGLRVRVAETLRPRAGATPRVRGRLTRAGLVVAQVAVAVTLVAGAGLFVRSLIAALTLNAGLDMSRVVIGTIHLGPYGYTPQRAAQFFTRLADELERAPAIDAVALSRWEGGMTAMGSVRVDGAPRQFPSMVSYIRVDPAFFRVMNIRVVEGRTFDAGDRQGSSPVAIVSESLARAIGDRRSVGRRLSHLAASNAPLEVVGVASDVILNLSVLEPLIVYLPASQDAPSVYRDFAVRSAARPAAAKAQLLDAIRRLDRQVTPTPPRTLEERVSEQMAPQRLGATVLGALGGLAVLLTLLGTYVTADSMASMRMKEMGIRAALGATGGQLAGLVVAETGRLVGVGVAAGLILTRAATSRIQSFLFQVQPSDALTLGAVTASILALAIGVSLRAAIRVARVDLAQVLRAE